MIRRRLPAAAVLGACAIALTVGVLPAHAVDRSIPIGTGSIPITGPTLVAPSTGTATGTNTPKGTGSTASTSSTSAGDSSKSSDTDSSDSGDILAGDGSSSDSQAGSEAGPIVRLDASSITPAELSWKGVKVVASGLTPNTRYQPYARLGSTSAPIGRAQTADVWGWISFTWKPKDAVPTGVRSIGMEGLQGQTDGVEQQLTVKYDSGMSWHATKREGDAVTLAITVNRSSAGERYAPWTGVPVLIQKRAGGRWRTVRTVTASAKGVAKATIVSATAQWRAKVAETTTVFGVVSSTHRR